MSHQNQHIARKRFGQNFLHDPHVIQHIVNAIHPQKQDNLLEIGPGKGALTKALLPHCPRLQAIELDRDLIPMLRNECKQYHECQIHEGDALQFDFTRLGSSANPLRIVGNLPYNISTPLIFHLLASHQIITDMHFMLQKEVVDRLAAKPDSKSYGRLSVIVQYYCHVEALLDIPPSAFKPMPKVDSSVVRLVPYEELPVTAKDENRFRNIVKQAFSHRRKTIRNTLKDVISAEALEQLGIASSQRAENLTIKDFVTISNLSE